MYLALGAANPGPVLELAAGSGRIAVALAATGHDVTGVDRDPDMLDRARQAWARRQREGSVVAGGSLHLIEADILDLDLERQFEVVILALNSLLLLGGDEAKRRALEVMARHLTASGCAVIDVWLPTADDLELYDGHVMLDWIRDDDEAGQKVAKSWSATYDEARNRAIVTTTFDLGVRPEPGTQTVRQDEIWFVGGSGLMRLAQSAGLRVVTASGDYDLSSSTSQSERVVLICRKGAA